MKHTDKEQGFTLIELLVALSIVALMMLVLILGEGLQLSRGEDARRKGDLAKLKIAFEDYYNDKGCYPPKALLQSCGSGDLAPYIAKVPCDPRTKQPYPYYMDSNCKWYALYSTLGDTKDPVISTLGCFPTCGVKDEPYNYIQTNGALTPGQVAEEVNALGIGAGESLPAPTAQPSSSPGSGGGGGPPATPSGGGDLACDPSGTCNVYDNPAGNGCPVTFTDPNACQAACANPANRCPR